MHYQALKRKKYILNMVRILWGCEGRVKRVRQKKVKPQTNVAQDGWLWGFEQGFGVGQTR